MTAQRPSRRLNVAVLLVAGILVAAGLAGPALGATSAPSADSGFLSRINGLRSARGLAPLTLDPELSRVARAWSNDMASRGTLAHNGALASQVTQSWITLGENVGTGSTVGVIFDALVNSADHLRNMSDPAYSRIGIGTVDDGRGVLWTTHVFLQPAGGGTATTRPPAPPPTTARPQPTTAPTRRPVVTTVAPVPTTNAAAPAAVVSPTSAPPAGPAPAPTAVADGGEVAAAPLGLPGREPVASVPRQPIPGPLLAFSALLALLVLGSTGLVLRRSRAAGAQRPAR